MHSFDRYIRVLRLFLPRANRDDIIRELNEDYCSQVADAEAARDRALTADERAAIVRQFGHPLVGAARYWRQQHLIGPPVFSFYWPVLGAALLLNTVVHATSAAVVFALHRSVPDLLSIAVDLGVSTFTLIGFVTVAFAVFERWGLLLNGAAARRAARVVHRAVRGVTPALEMAETIARPFDQRGFRAAGGGRRPEDRSVTGLIMSTIFVAWWLLALRFPSLMFLTGADQLAWAPAMDRVYPVIAAANLLFIAGEGLRRTSLHDSRLLRVLRVAALAADVLFLALIITSDYRWVTWRGDSIDGREVQIVGIVNVVMTGVMLAIAFGVATRWLRSPRRGLTTTPPHSALA